MLSHILKAKAWIVKNWMWILFPVGILIYLFGYIAAFRLERTPYVKDTERHVNDVMSITSTKEKELKNNEVAHLERVEQAIEEQQTEAKELQNSSLGEKVKWFDNL